MFPIISKLNTFMFPVISKLDAFMRQSFVFALDTQDPGNPDPSDKITKGFTSLSNMLQLAMGGVGVIFIVMGAISIATAVKSGEQNPEAITGAIKNIIIGCLLAGIGWVVGLFLDD